jgi:hypothetical protein
MRKLISWVIKIALLISGASLTALSENTPPMSRLRRLQIAPLLALAVLLGVTGRSRLSAADDAAPAESGELAEGQSLTLKAEVNGGEGPFHYLWFKDYEAIPGAVSPELRFESLRPGDSGTYWVTVFNDSGSTTSPPEHVIVRSGTSSRMTNVSVVGSADDRIVVGFTLGGSGTSGSTDILARAAGPALLPLGVAGTLADPVLSIFQQGSLVFTNDDWDGGDFLATVSAAVGAFPFSTASKDAALMLSLSGAKYSAEVVDGTRGGGIAVVEIYDTTQKPTRASPRLISISARGSTRVTGAPPLTAGFTIQGETTVTVLVRGVGPSLERLGVTGGVVDPKLSLFRGPTLVSSNENWSDSSRAAIEAAQAAVGAFPLNENSLDSALLVSLKPGSYTAQISGAASPGVAQIEVYEVP